MYVKQPFRALKISLLALLLSLVITQSHTLPINPFPVPEYYPSESVIIRYPFNSNIWHIYEQLIMECQEAAHTYLLVNNDTERQALQNLLYNAGIPMNNITLLMVTANRMWVRDHGPIGVRTSTGPALMEFIDYNNSGYSDQILPMSLANEWDYQHYSFPFILDGGNYMVDSQGTMFTTTRLYTNNPSFTHAQINKYLTDYLGVTSIITVSPQHNDYWGHIDMQIKLLNDTTFVVSSVTPGSGPNYAILESNVAVLEGLTAPNGNPYHIARLPKADNWKTYANALILNDKIIVPIYGHANDQFALDTYSSLMPDHTVVGINSSAIIGWGGAIHCITMQVFEWQPQDFHLSLEVQGHGMVMVDGNAYEGTLALAEGETFTLQAYPDEGFVFDGWHGDFSGQQNPVELLATGNLVIEARFRRVAANYVSFLPKRHAAFYDPNSRYITFTKIINDSIFDEGIAMFFAPDQIIEQNDLCINVENSRFGEKVLLLNDGYEVYFNKNNDSIKLNTLALPGDTWKIFSNDDFIIKGEVVSHQPETILDITDSVKTIALEVYNADMEPVEHFLREHNIKISKGYGVVSTIRFYDFPGNNTWLVNDSWRFSLVGLENPALGVQNLTWMNVHNLQPGDKLHVTELHDAGYLGDFYQRTSEIILKYFERIDYPDSVRYHIERIKTDRIKHSPLGEPTVITTHDTIIRTYKPWEYFDHHATELFVHEDKLTYHSQRYNPQNNLMSKIIELTYLEYDSWYECWSYGIGHYPLGATTYLDGLSGPYYDYQDDYWAQWKRSLVYYKKGEETWGDPLNITNVTNVSTDAKVKVFPNPAANTLHVSLANLGEQTELQLIDALGRVVVSKTIHELSTVINVEQLTEGLYYYQITIPHTEKITGKVIIKR